MKQKKLTSLDVEVAVAQYFGPRQNLAVPNLSHGLLKYEADLVFMTKSGYLTEVEIKVTKADVKRDLEKNHRHDDPRIKQLYFAIPDYLDTEEVRAMIPQRAGILTVSSDRDLTYRYVKCTRNPYVDTSTRALGLSDMYQFARLGALRIWALKRDKLRAKAELLELRGRVKLLQETAHGTK